MDHTWRKQEDEHNEWDYVTDKAAKSKHCLESLDYSDVSILIDLQLCNETCVARVVEIDWSPYQA
jgi:hypothetical protein